MKDNQPGCEIQHMSDAGFSIDFEESVYRLSAVKKAAYRFGDRFFIRITQPDDLHIRASLQSRGLRDDLDDVAGEFCNEVLDQELREVVAEETQGIRDLIMSQAFSAVSLVDAEGDEGDYRDDPLGIRGASSPGNDSTEA